MKALLFSAALALALLPTPQTFADGLLTDCMEWVRGHSGKLGDVVGTKAPIRSIQDVTELDAVVDLALRVFNEDPLFTWMSPTEFHRRKLLKSLIRQAWMRGEILAPADQLSGFALWLQAEDVSSGPLGALLNGQYWLPLLSSPARIRNLIRYDRYFARVRRELCGEDPCLYLLLIGVDPEYQGQGIGTSLIDPILKLAQERGQHVLLDVHKPENIGYYKRLGFEIVHRARFPAGAPETVTMRWKPQD